MSKMRKQQRDITGGNGICYKREDKGLWLFQGVHWFFSVQHPGNPMRALRHGKRENQNHQQNKGCTYMSKLRSSVLRALRIAGNNSGCHQLPERSFFVKGYQVPVCARCTGVFIGQLTAVLLALLKHPFPFISSVFCMAVMGADWGLQALDIRKSTNVRRFITGICGGLGLFSLYLLAAGRIFRYLKRRTAL